MFYVYCYSIGTGRADMVNRTYDTAKDAIEHIRLCYNTDKELGQLGNYYYYMKERA